VTTPSGALGGNTANIQDIRDIFGLGANFQQSFDDFSLALSAGDVDLYRACPLKYKLARVLSIPQEPTINQRFGILVHQVLERFHGASTRGILDGMSQEDVETLKRLEL
jgi:hypothetical protein